MGGLFGGDSPEPPAPPTPPPAPPSRDEAVTARRERDDMRRRRGRAATILSENGGNQGARGELARQPRTATSQLLGE